MSDSAAPPTSEREEKPKRNPTERIIVWGVIGFGVIVACAEGAARYGYMTTLPILQARMVEDDASANPRPLTLAEADGLIAGFPSKTDEDDKVIYRWKGIFKDHGAIHLAYDSEDNIIRLETDAPPEIPEPVQPTIDETEGEDDPAAMSGPGGGGPGAEGGSGGGNRNFDPMQFDEDGDGKISLEEAPERMKESFDQIDTNSDGFADAEEFEARRAARQRERSEEGDGGQSGRPQRPGADEAAPAESPSTPTPDPLGTEAKPKAEAEAKPEAEAEAKPEAKAEPDPQEN